LNARHFIYTFLINFLHSVCLTALVFAVAGWYHPKNGVERLDCLLGIFYHFIHILLWFLSPADPCSSPSRLLCLCRYSLAVQIPFNLIGLKIIKYGLKHLWKRILSSKMEIRCDNMSGIFNGFSRAYGNGTPCIWLSTQVFRLCSSLSSDIKSQTVMQCDFKMNVCNCGTVWMLT